MLPARIDSAAACAVAEGIQARCGRSLTLDARQVEFAGALGLQVLIAARRQWREAGHAFRVTGADEALFDICRTLGVAPAHIGAGPEEEAPA
ncbi:hypothetical protein A3731_07420 [Roseovarius sp. HI0049]|nr:hypothetical protein A3731_07420 [Roseovarius sp. HI0049]